MSDVVVTVPKHLWGEWIAEGDLPGDDPADSPLEPGGEWAFYISSSRLPKIVRGERVYVIAHGKLRGYSPLTLIREPTWQQIHGAQTWGQRPTRSALCRRFGAVACTIAEPVRGFQGWRYRWWDRDAEMPFPDWRTP